MALWKGNMAIISKIFIFAGIEWGTFDYMNYKTYNEKDKMSKKIQKWVLCGCVAG